MFFIWERQSHIRLSLFFIAFFACLKVHIYGLWLCYHKDTIRKDYCHEKKPQTSKQLVISPQLLYMALIDQQ